MWEFKNSEHDFDHLPRMLYSWRFLWDTRTVYAIAYGILASSLAYFRAICLILPLTKSSSSE